MCEIDRYAINVFEYPQLIWRHGNLFDHWRYLCTWWDEGRTNATYLGIINRIYVLSVIIFLQTKLNKFENLTRTWKILNRVCWIQNKCEFHYRNDLVQSFWHMKFHKNVQYIYRYVNITKYINMRENITWLIWLTSFVPVVIRPCQLIHETLIHIGVHNLIPKSVMIKIYRVYFRIFHWFRSEMIIFWSINPHPYNLVSEIKMNQWIRNLDNIFFFRSCRHFSVYQWIYSYFVGSVHIVSVYLHILKKKKGPTTFQCYLKIYCAS